MDWAWVDGGLRLMPDAHNYPAELKTTKALKLVFSVAQDVVCWWCGNREDWWTGDKIHADHIAPLCYYSPRVVACRRCNWRRRGVIPNPDQLSRLFWASNIVRDRPAAEMREWAQRQAAEIFGGYAKGVSLLLAKTGRMPVRLAGGPNSTTLGVCDVSNRICQRAGYDPPKGD